MTIDYDAIVTCEACGCEMTASELDGIITVRGARGEFLGRIYSGDVSGDWDKIENGACPICDEWEDGNGHACTAYGFN